MSAPHSPRGAHGRTRCATPAATAARSQVRQCPCLQRSTCATHPAMRQMGPDAGAELHDVPAQTNIARTERSHRRSTTLDMARNVNPNRQGRPSQGQGVPRPPSWCRHGLPNDRFADQECGREMQGVERLDVPFNGSAMTCVSLVMSNIPTLSRRGAPSASGLPSRRSTRTTSVRSSRDETKSVSGVCIHSCRRTRSGTSRIVRSATEESSAPMTLGQWSPFSSSSSASTSTDSYAGPPGRFGHGVGVEAGGV